MLNKTQYIIIIKKNHQIYKIINKIKINKKINFNIHMIIKYKKVLKTTALYTYKKYLEAIF